MARTKQRARRNSPPLSISIRAAIASAQAMEQAAECDRERAERDREREEGDRERATGDREREEGDRERTEQCPFCGVEGVHVCAGQRLKKKEIFLGTLALSTLLLTDLIFHIRRPSLQPQAKGAGRP